jgi:hypothetical protein
MLDNKKFQNAELAPKCVSKPAAKHKQKLRFLFTIVIILILCIILFRNNLKHSSSHSSLLNFGLTDISGESIVSADFMNNYSVLAFIDDRDSNDISFLVGFADVISKFNIKGAAIIRNLPSDHENFSNSTHKGVYIVNAKSQIRYPLNLRYGEYHIYDKKGNLIYVGKTIDNYFGKGNLEYHLRRAIENVKFDLSLYLKNGTKLEEYEYLRQLTSIILTNLSHKFFLFAFFRTFCESCGVGTIIRYLGIIEKKYPGIIFIAIILSNKYTDRDIEGLRSQTRITSPIFLSDDVLSDEWEKMVKDYSDNDLSIMGILTDNTGTVLKTLDSSCGCTGVFFHDLERMIVTGK